MNEKLKPCPFCGYEPYLFRDNFSNYAIACSVCKLYFGIEIEDGVPLLNGWTAHFYTRKGAILAWNNRKRRKINV